MSNAGLDLGFLRMKETYFNYTTIKSVLTNVFGATHEAAVSAYEQICGSEVLQYTGQQYSKLSQYKMSTDYQTLLMILYDDYMLVILLFLLTIVLIFASCGKSTRKNDGSNKTNEDYILSNLSTLTVFDLAKTAYKAGHTEALIELVRQRHFNINYPLPSTGLTLFLCACLSGQRKLVKYFLTNCADATMLTKEGDSALYLATYGVLSSPCPDTYVLLDLISAGCNVNTQNHSGYTALHRAASKGSIEVIRFLLKHGADPYIRSVSGIYPIDLATNAGHLEAAELLQIQLDNPHGWDIIEPHTPLHIRLGLQSPMRTHLAQSTFIPKSVKRVANLESRPCHYY